MASYSTQTTATSITVTVSNADSEATYTIYCRLASETTAEEHDATSYTFTGLSSNTNYVVNVREKKGETTTFLGASTVTTKHLTPLIYLFMADQTSLGSTSVSYQWGVTDLESTATYSISAQAPGGSWVTLKAPSAATETGSGTVSLSSIWTDFDTYKIRITVENATDYDDYRDVSVIMEPEPIPDFSWTYPKISGQPFNLTATEWNDMWEAIELRLGHSYSHTTAVQNNIFTAAMYNEAVSAIGTGTTVSKGDTITAALMNQLVTNINNMS